jgi:hypothetical protein
MSNKEAGDSGKEKPHRPSYLDAWRYAYPKQAALANLKAKKLFDGTVAVRLSWSAS